MLLAFNELDASNPKSGAAARAKVESSSFLTFGQLIKAVRRARLLPRPIDAQLDAAREERNWLAHHFYSESAPLTAAPASRAALPSKLRGLTRRFTGLDAQLQRFLYAFLQEKGVSPSTVRSRAEAILGRLAES